MYSLLILFVLWASVVKGQTIIGDRCGKDPITLNDYGSCNPDNYCCSAFGYCGTTSDYCVGCQKKYGYCPAQCDVNTNFCGPFSITSFVLGVIAVLISIISLFCSCKK